MKYKCKYCGAKQTNPDGVCYFCLEKIRLIRQIKAMLMPYYKSKKEREKQNGNQR
jgi:hypothetical protein